MMRGPSLYGTSRGYFCFEGPDGTKEADSFTCQHCNFITKVGPFTDPANIGGYCKGCGKLICRGCVGKPCDPLEAKLERAEKRGEALRSYGY